MLECTLRILVLVCLGRGDVQSASFDKICISYFYSMRESDVSCTRQFAETVQNLSLKVPRKMHLKNDIC